MLGKLGVLLQIAWRNLFATWLNVIIGLVILGGTFLVVIGGSALDSLARSMRGSIIGSVSGDVQVYSAKSEEDLALFGTTMGNESDIAPITNFADVNRVLSQVDNVAAVVPMGFKGAMITNGNTVDVMLARLREQVTRQQAGDASEETKARIASLSAHVRHIVGVLNKQRANATEIAEETALEERDQLAIDKALSDEFWASFQQDPLASLEFLENRIAPQLTDGDIIYIRYMGTDLDKFQAGFERMEIVDGTAVPSGVRGLLMPKFTYEELFKLKTARRLDRIKEERTENAKLIATDKDLARMVRENVSQTRDILLQLDPMRTVQAVQRLQKALGSKETDLEKLLRELLQTTDENFDARYRIFYSELAPLLELYRVRMGDEITIKAFTDSGYVESANVKLYGTFSFRGLEKSPLAGVTSLMDMMTFRDLYGYMTPERKAEIARLKAQSGAKEVSREDAEAALFGGDAELVSEGESTTIDAAELFAQDGLAEREAPTTFTQADIDNGVVLNAAVLLNDDQKLGQTIRAIDAAAQKHGLELKVVEGPRATGLFGQLIDYIHYALYLVAGIIFLVAMVILSNAVLMATLQRIREIGTVRAIGAQRGFVRWMVVVETTVLGTVFGLLGALLGAGAIAAIGRVGIPARSDEAYFFFGGPRWYPELSPTYIVLGYLIVLVVSLGAALYPAFLATRVSPLQAMQTED